MNGPSNALNRLSSANFSAQAAEQICLACIPLIAVTQLGADVRTVGLIGVAQTLPFLLLAIPIGLAVDRSDPKRVMWIAELVRASSLMVLLGCALANWISVPALIALGFLGATGTVAFSIAVPSAIPRMVETAALSVANARVTLATSVAAASGPALGGMLVGGLGATAAFAVAFVCSVACLALIRALPLKANPSGASARSATSRFDEIREGWRFASRHEVLRPLLLTTIFWNLSWFVLHAVFASYAVRHLQLSAQQIGLTLSAYGLGMIVGSLSATRIIARIRFGHVLVIGPLLSVFGMSFVVATQWFDPRAAMYAAMGGYFLFGFGPILWSVSTATLRQHITPNALLGRVSSIFMTLSWGSRPIGAALASTVALIAVAENVSAELINLWIALAGFGAQFLVIAFSALPRMLELPKNVNQVGVTA